MDVPSIVSPSTKENTFAAAARPYLYCIFHGLRPKEPSITQIYYLSHTAREKLISEASQADLKLRLVVGHANLLDSLTLRLADTDREQQSQCKQPVSGNLNVSQGSRHIQWASTVAEIPEEDWSAEDASDLESDEHDGEDGSDFDDSALVFSSSILRAPLPVVPAHQGRPEEDDDDTESDIEYDNVRGLEELGLARIPSRQPPPKLSKDSCNEPEN